MGRFVNSGNSAFQVALNSEIYVDKTGLLAYTNKVMDTTAKFICNSRPRRFGKSITADMLTAYYCKGCSSEEMFSSLEISQAPDFTKYLNQYDVIHLDIQWCMEPAGGPENVVSYITEKTILELNLYLKWNQNAQTAIRQIKNRQYPEAVANYTDNILLVGISYDKKQKTHNCVIEKYSEK